MNTRLNALEIEVKVYPWRVGESENSLGIWGPGFEWVVKVGSRGK